MFPWLAFVTEVFMETVPFIFAVGAFLIIAQKQENGPF
jgi:hypothetical protein